jgi:hypothetical protein
MVETLIILKRPPNFDQILAAFPKADQPGVIFAYGDAIYSPSGFEILPALVAHEGVHLARQKDHARPEDWWEWYIKSDDFRYTEELLAHAAEYKVLAVGDRNFCAGLLVRTAARLTATLYNYQPPRTLQQAMRDLRREIEK